MSAGTIPPVRLDTRRSAPVRSAHRTAVQILVALICLVGSAWVAIDVFGLPGWKYLIVAFAAAAYEVCLVRVRAHGCLVPGVLIVGAFVVFGLLIDHADAWSTARTGSERACGSIVARLGGSAHGTEPASGSTSPIPAS